MIHRTRKDDPYISLAGIGGSSFQICGSDAKASAFATFLFSLGADDEIFAGVGMSLGAMSFRAARCAGRTGSAELPGRVSAARPATLRTAIVDEEVIAAIFVPTGALSPIATATPPVVGDSGCFRSIGEIVAQLVDNLIHAGGNNLSAPSNPPSEVHVVGADVTLPRCDTPVAHDDRERQ